MPSDPTRSVIAAQEKARELRMQRLTKTLDEKLGEPIPVVDALMAELGEGAAHPELWEKLHAAAIRDKNEAKLADAYTRAAAGPRMKRLSADAQAAFCIHAADWFQGVMGDATNGDTFLQRALELVPSNVDAFQRRERRLEQQLDRVKLLELYAMVATTPPRDPKILAGQATQKLFEIAGKESVSEAACKKLVALVIESPRLLDALEQHCRATKRAALACACIEQAIADQAGDDPTMTTWRERLVDLYLGEAANPAEAIAHVEKLLEKNPTHAKAVPAAEKLLSVGKVASRAATALREARRKRG